MADRVMAHSAPSFVHSPPSCCEAGKLLDITARIVPVVRGTRRAGALRRSPLPPRTMGGCGCHDFGSHHVPQSVVPAVEGRRPLGEEPDDFQRLLEAGEALGDRAELDAVGLTLGLEPATPSPSSSRPPEAMSTVTAMLASTAVAVRHAGDHDAAAQPSGARAASPSTSSLRGSAPRGRCARGRSGRRPRRC